ncbi:unnamed protein product [Ixodes pacificus]
MPHPKKRKPFEHLSRWQKRRRLNEELSRATALSSFETTTAGTANVNSEHASGSENDSQVSARDTLDDNSLEFGNGSSSSDSESELESSTGESTDITESETDSSCEEVEALPEQLSLPESVSDKQPADTDDPERRLRRFLAQWAGEHKITQRALSSLAKELKEHPCYSGIPGDSRTLLATPRRANITSVPPGSYCHFGIADSLTALLSHVVDMSSVPARLGIMFYVDGLPLTKNTHSQFWPILGKTLDVTGSGVFLVGCYHGHSKPTSVDEYLSVFIDDLDNLLTNGLPFSGQLFTVYIRGFVCDAPAKAFLLGIKSHSGFFGCGKCTQEGVFVDGTVVFLETDAPLRTDEAFAQKAQGEHHVKDTPLKSLPLGLVSKFPLDFMHLVCIGVTKKLLLLWMKGSKSYRLPSVRVNEVSQRLLDLKQFCCTEFARLPRPLKDQGFWKATELRCFLLYLGPVVLKGVLDQERYEHFLVLHVAIRILANPSMCTTYNNYAKELLCFFVHSFKSLYGRGKVSYNVHGLVHLADDVVNYGALDNFSAFPAESFMFQLKRLVRSSTRPLEQLHKRISELKTSRKLYAFQKDAQPQVAYKQMHMGGQLPSSCEGPQFHDAVFPQFVLKSTVGDNCCILSDSSIVLVSDFCFDKVGSKVLLGRQFMTSRDFFTSPCKSSDLGIFTVSTLSSCKVWPLSNVQAKCVLLANVGLCNEYLVFPLLHSV